MPRSRFAGAVVVCAIALASPAAAEARQRCCLKTTITERGSLTQDFDEGSDREIGRADSDWTWVQRMILVYEENGGAPSLTLAKLHGREVRPSVVYFGKATSSVQIKQPDGSYRPFAEPNDCGGVSYKSRRRDIPSFTKRRFATPGARATFSNANVFLIATFAVSFDNNDSCLFGGGTVNIDYWKDQACQGSGGFALPAPPRAWFRHGDGRLEKQHGCNGAHDEPSNDRRELAAGLADMALQWIAPKQVEEYAKRLKKAHANANSPYDD
jgi:hypothetical protein